MSKRTELTETATEILEISNESEFDEILENNDRVFADFYADWCGPCQMMEETVEAVSETVDTTVVKIDIDAHPQVAARFDVSSIPTFIGFNDGTPDGRLIGMQDEDSLRQLAG